MNLSPLVSFLADRHNQQWVVRLLLIAFIFLLLAWCVWCYFDWRVQQLLTDSPPG